MPAGAATFALDAVDDCVGWGGIRSAASGGVLVPAVPPRRVPVIGVVIVVAGVGDAEVAVDGGEGLGEAARWRCVLWI